MSETAVWLRLTAALGALALGVAAVTIVVVLAHRTPGPTSTSISGTPIARDVRQSDAAAFPAPPPGAVTFSRPDGHDVLALAVVPGKKLKLQASVLGGQGEGVDGLDVSFRVDARKAAGVPCGPGCYGASVGSRARPKVVEVDVRRDGGTTRWRMPMPRVWPPPDASPIVARAAREFRSLHSVAVRDWLASGPGQSLFTRWTLVAPNRLAYQVKNGSSAVIIGNRRWDKLPGGKWEESEQTPIRQPTPFWQSWTDAHLLDETKSTWHVSFFDPKTPGWYELLIDKDTTRVLELRMHATAHFMREVYSRFNAPVTIRPPD